MVQRVRFSPDGHHMVAASRNGTAAIWNLVAAPEVAPDWLPSLAERFGGLRINASKSAEIVDSSDFEALVKKIRILPQTNAINRLAHSLIAERDARSPAP
jgi:hypothetical protein